MIPQRNISLLANRLARAGNRRIAESVLERDYCLAWLLSSLAESELRGKLAFKGGTALKRCYFGDYRFSEDLDFSGNLKPYHLESLLKKTVGKTAQEAVRFDVVESKATSGGYLALFAAEVSGLRLQFVPFASRTSKYCRPTRTKNGVMVGNASADFTRNGCVASNQSSATSVRANNDGPRGGASFSDKASTA